MKSESQFSTPILFIIFNRPDTTQIVFNKLKQLKPKKLYISADGPRKNKDGEAEKCKLTREIINQVDWECDVKKLFNDENLGCKKAVSNAITWFFENEDQGIILEDDVVPAKSFFDFCSSLLAYYKDDSDIMHISGNNFFSERIDIPFSYYFSIYPHIWGWATWRRAWKLFNAQIPDFPEYKSNNSIDSILKDRREKKYWLRKFELVYNNQVDTWDYQWLYTIWKNKALCITPVKNLATNIGFRDDATHTVNKNSKLADIPVEEINNIVHPDKKIISQSFDKITFQEIHYLSLLDKIKIKLGF
ncbi:hypothetical protein [Ignavibacterium sp.]|uniref:hypothetical protein n=1 Tax=Ignavibacterium sp. TaxID=2651167 RepID=UPI0021F9C9F7|nr:hypothetical protein [Ignavibacterium sp.]BDQ03134.1 MAG: hemolytic protein HlpA [Ignavibacterium sp.]